MPLNKHKGDVAVTIGGVAMAMRPTFEAMAEFEERAGVIALDLVNELRHATEEGRPLPFRMKTVAAALWAGLRAGADKPEAAPSYHAITEILMEEGVHAFQEAIGEWLLHGVIGRRNMEKVIQGALGNVEGPASQPAE